MYRQFIPGLAITGTSLLCPNLKSSAANVPFRPPSWVFGVVWPLLYFTTGYAWRLSKEDVLFTAIVGLCCLWLIAYSCAKNKEKAAAIIVASAVTTWYTVAQLDGTARTYLLPLAFWLTFASYLNIYEQYILQ
jgi:benzodiazapine receptor